MINVKIENEILSKYCHFIYIFAKGQMVQSLNRLVNILHHLLLYDQMEKVLVSWDCE